MVDGTAEALKRSLYLARGRVGGRGRVRVWVRVRVRYRVTI